MDGIFCLGLSVGMSVCPLMLHFSNRFMTLKLNRVQCSY